MLDSEILQSARQIITLTVKCISFQRERTMLDAQPNRMSKASSFNGCSIARFDLDFILGSWSVFISYVKQECFDINFPLRASYSFQRSI